MWIPSSPAVASGTGAGSPAPLDLDALIEIALRDNPGLASLRFEADSLGERTGRERAFPDPTATVGYMPVDLVTANGPVGLSLEVMQPIPLRGKRGLRSDRARANAEAAEAAWQAARMDVVRDVKVVYHELFRIDRSLEILAEEEAVLERLMRVAGARYGAGLVPQGDVLRAQTERWKLDERRLSLREERGVAAAALNRLLGRSPLQTVGPALTSSPEREVPPQGEEMLAAARRDRPEVRQALDQVSAGEASEALARKEFGPDFFVGVGWTQIGDTANPFAPDPGQDAYMVKFGLTIPIGRAWRRAALAESQAETNAARLRVTDRERQVEAEARAALEAVHARRDLVLLYASTLIPQARSSVEAAESAYAADRGGFLEVLDSERTLLEMRLAHAVEQGRLGAARAQLDRALGSAVPAADVAMAEETGR